MASRLKEEEKNERIIRGLLKLTPNRRCINCNSLGPQYVCTNFWTFVCTNCSGIHREFTHRVKSVSMAKFTLQEVSALQEGGNQRAREIFFKEWDPQRHSFPDSSNIDRLRDFIKHVYVDRRFAVERTSDKPPKITTGDKDDYYENRRMDTYQGGTKSPPYEDTNVRHYSDGSSPGGRSPGYDQESRQYGDYKRSPGRPPIINDWRREDRFGDGKKFDDSRISDGSNRVGSYSPQPSKDLDSSGSPVVRPVRDILGENVVPLRVIEPPKTNSARAADGSALTQRTASSNSLASGNGTSAQVKVETIKSLIDFDDDPEPQVAPAFPQAQQSTVTHPVILPENSNDNNWASFDVAPEPNAAQGPSNVNPLESVLSQLSIPASLPSRVSAAQGPVTGSAPTASVSGVPTVSSLSTFPSNGALVTSTGLSNVSPFNNPGQWTGLQSQQPFYPATISQPTTQQVTPFPGNISQPWNITSVPTNPGQLNTPMPHSSHQEAKPDNEARSSVASQTSNADVKPSGRNELPEDLFTVKYSSFPAPVPGWQMGIPHGMATSIQYNNVVPMPSFSQPSNSLNPFDVANGPTPARAPSFPSMSSLQGALPSVTPSGPMHPSSLGNPSVAWNPPSVSYVSVLPPQAQNLPSAMGPRAYMGQQMSTNMPMSRQEIGTFGSNAAAFGFSTPNPFPAGNPFG